MPSLSASFNVNSTSSDASDLVTPSFTPAVNDVIVVKGIVENDVAAGFATPTDTQGNAYTLQHSKHTFSGTTTSGWIWTAIAGSATAMTVSVGISEAHWRSITVEDWANAALDATPATNSTKTGSGAPSATLTTTQDNSMVSWLNGDWAAVDPVGHTYNGTSATPTEDGLHDKHSPTFYVAYYAWQPAGTAGSQTLGLTAPGGQTWCLLGMEILHVGGGGDPTPDQYNQYLYPAVI